MPAIHSSMQVKLTMQWISLIPSLLDVFPSSGDKKNVSQSMEDAECHSMSAHDKDLQIRRWCRAIY